MKIKLTAPVGTSSPAEERDIVQIKRALNRLGYYIPYNKVGITGIPDQAIFDALKAFQKDRNLLVTGSLRPHDLTLTALNKDLAKPSKGFYVWRTVGDDKVRNAHAALDGDTRAWSGSPTPGDEPGCRCWAEPLSHSAEDRKKALLGQGRADFTLKPNPDAKSDRPFYTIHSYNEVNQNRTTIERESSQAGINADLVKAIIYVETTQGYYDRFVMGWNESIRPMNIRISYWKELGYTRDDIEDPHTNIKVGIDLLRRIQENMPGATIAEIATIYNNLGAAKISDYGARVEIVYKTKPWTKN